MIVGLLVAKDKSLGFPGKHKREILGRPLVEYPLMVADKSKSIEKLFISTDSPFISEIGKKYNGIILERPKELAQPDTLLEDSLVYAYNQMLDHVDEPIEMVVLLFGNSPMISLDLLEQGIETLKENPEIDTAFSVSDFNMFSPARAYKVGSNNLIEPFMDKSILGDISSIRDSAGDCYFCTLQVQVMRSRCFTNMDEGRLPYRWMGKSSLAIKGDVGFDIDFEWQIPVAEYWLQKNGFTIRNEK